MPDDLKTLADEDFCYLTTTGRISGRAHTIEIWFAFMNTPSICFPVLATRRIG